MHIQNDINIILNVIKTQYTAQSFCDLHALKILSMKLSIVFE